MNIVINKTNYNIDIGCFTCKFFNPLMKDEYRCSVPGYCPAIDIPRLEIIEIIKFLESRGKKCRHTETGSDIHSKKTT